MEFLQPADLSQHCLLSELQVWVLGRENLSDNEGTTPWRGYHPKAAKNTVCGVVVG